MPEQWARRGRQGRGRPNVADARRGLDHGSSLIFEECFDDYTWLALVAAGE